MIIERYIGMKSEFVFRPMQPLEGKSMSEAFKILYCFKKIERHGQKSMYQVTMEMDYSKSPIFDRLGKVDSFEGKPFYFPIVID